MHRREFLTGSGLALVGSGLTAAPQRPSTSSKERIIDFRVRPPFKGFLETANYRNATPPPIETFMEEVEEAGIDLAVVIGRQTPPSMRYRGSWGLPYGSVPNDDIAELVERYPGRLIGFAGIDGSTGDAALREIERCRGLGFKGIALDNGWCDPPLYDDDEQLLPIYEKCEKDALIVAITSSVAIGPDMDYSKPVHIQRIGNRFRELRIVVPHACWPWVELACTAAFRIPNLYLIPDYYIGMPGAELYVRWANGRLSRQILFASSHPGGGGPQNAVERYRNLPFESDEIRRRVMGENAAELLGL